MFRFNFFKLLYTEIHSSQPTFTMLPTMYHDLEIKFDAGVKHEIQEQSRNDEDHTTSNTEQNMNVKRV